MDSRLVKEAMLKILCVMLPGFESQYMYFNSIIYNIKNILLIVLFKTINLQNLKTMYVYKLCRTV